MLMLCVQMHCKLLRFSRLVRTLFSRHESFRQSKLFLCSTSCAAVDEHRQRHLEAQERLRQLRQKFGYQKHQFEELTLDKYQNLITDKSVEAKIQLILSEYEFEKYTTLKVPTSISESDMQRLLQEPDENNRKKVFVYLYKKENAHINDVVKKLANREEFQTKKQLKYSGFNSGRTGIFDNEGNILYGLWHNSLVSKISPTAVKRLRASLLKMPALFGQKLVIDLDFDQFMTLRECRLMLKQIAYLYGHNRYNVELPFDLHFCNVKMDSLTMANMRSFIPNYQEPNSYLSFHAHSYLDVFPRKNLIYLTPDAGDCLKKYNPDDIYIIGGIVDKCGAKPLTYAKAKKEGIRMARLPIDEHVVWNVGTKSLCLNHVHSILHDWAVTRDWKIAFKKHIPTRKLKNEQQIELEDSLRLKRYKKQLNMIKQRMQELDI